MKSIFVLLIILLTYANADELQRIESVVEDIKKLRIDYEKSQEELSLALVKLKDERDKNAILLNELKKSEDRVDDLKKQMKFIEKSAKNRESKNSNIINYKDFCLKNQIEKENKFPKLQMKDASKELVITDTKATTFRLNKNAVIYDGVDGNRFEEWEERTSFTSNRRSQAWIKITGYFVDKKWQKATQELWIRAEDATQR
jgi:hypothetical protein